jgi:type I restriction enzyme S subunit
VPQHFFYHSLLKINLSNYGYAWHFKFLKQTRTIIPNHDISNQFEEKIKSFHNQIKHNIFETYQLEELRDWLLPMLMNGQVSIKDS